MIYVVPDTWERNVAGEQQKLRAVVDALPPGSAVPLLVVSVAQMYTGIESKEEHHKHLDNLEKAKPAHEAALLTLALTLTLTLTLTLP